MTKNKEHDLTGLFQEKREFARGSGIGRLTSGAKPSGRFGGRNAVEDISALLGRFGVDNSALSGLVIFKQSEVKNDPSRHHGIHGPYEEMFLRQWGRLPEDYFQGGDPEPWGLRVEEARSNIIYQVASGIVDHSPTFGARYLALATMKGIGHQDYVEAHRTLNREWGDFSTHFDNKGIHNKMKEIYGEVSCPACNIAGALAAHAHPEMLGLFKQMQAHTGKEARIRFLNEHGLTPLLKTIIPDTMPTFKMGG